TQNPSSDELGFLHCARGSRDFLPVSMKNPASLLAGFFYCRVAGKLVAQPVSRAFLMARCRFRHACAIYSDA
ncbi:hypothetical protein, partial [Chromobacterium violaceum]|uniref:hypothetical protein n=1 Tax=Chromobacterium violaceum TaxID=536 RepID=UPI001BEB9CDF